MKRTAPKRKMRRAAPVSVTRTAEVPQKYMEPELPRRIHTIYNRSHVARVEQLARIGLTQFQLAVAFGVSIKTLEQWIRTHDDFREAYERGRDVHDYGVQESLLQRATGFDYWEIKEIEGVDVFGRPYHYTTRTKKKVLGDVTAEIFFLKNRHPEAWADVHRQEVRTNVEIQNTLRLENLSDDERDLLRGVALKQITQGNGTNG